MVYIDKWESFMEAAQQLFISSPASTRYLVKYRHVDAKLVLKVTDDKVCLKFKTDQSQDVKKMTELNNLFMRLSCSAEVTAERASQIVVELAEEAAAKTAAEAEAAAKAAAAKAAKDAAAPAGGAEGVASSAGGGGNKKKKRR